MAQGEDDPAGDVEASPEAIRAEMGRTRAGLTRKLNLLKTRLLQPHVAFPSEERTSMPVDKKTTKSTSSSAKKSGVAKMAATAKPSAKSAKSKPAAKTSARAATAKSSSASKAKASKKPLARKVATKTSKVLGEMLTGAAVGAVTGAAAKVGNQPTAAGGSGDNGTGAAASSSRKKGAAAKSGKVVNDMLAGAAVGAVTGAAKAVLPKTPKTSKGQAKSKK
jgi:hypothetical protein